jgi:hypothetical protein
MCALFVGLPDVTVLAVDGRLAGPIRVHVEIPEEDRLPALRYWCVGEDRPVIELVDLPCFGRPARLVWHKDRWRCPRWLARSGRGPARTPRSARSGRRRRTVPGGGWLSRSAAMAAP